MHNGQTLSVGLSFLYHSFQFGSFSQNYVLKQEWEKDKTVKILWEKIGGHLQHGSIHSQHVYVCLALKNKKNLNVHRGYKSFRPYLFAQHYLLAPLHPRPLVFSLEPHHLPKNELASKQKFSSPRLRKRIH